MMTVAVTIGMTAMPIHVGAAPEELSLSHVIQGQVPAGREIASYSQAVSAIIGVLTTRFDLPVPHLKLLIYATREEFEDGLVEHLRLSRELAASTAKFAQSAVGGYRVLVNEPALVGKDWPYRVELLAHELTHGVQFTLANRPALLRHQWLLEGPAEWLAYNVTQALGLDQLADARTRLAAKVKATRERPNLVALDGFAEWSAARARYGYDATYSLSFLVVDFLVARHSFGALVDYFRRFGASSDPAANFKAAFGESVEDFDAAARRHLQPLLR